MRTLASWAALILIAGVGCSSSGGPKVFDGEAGSFAPGAGGRGGSGAGGTAGSAGGSAGRGGDGGTTAGAGGDAGAGGIGGTTGTGGSAGATGAGGRGGVGGGTGGIMNTGAAGNPGSCPASPPTPGMFSCTTDTTAICNYPGETCACRAEGAVNVWNCITCPAFEPVNGSSCTPPTGGAVGGINCPYGNNFCACRSDNAWYCRCNGCP